MAGGAKTTGRTLAVAAVVVVAQEEVRSSPGAGYDSRLYYDK